MMAGFREGAEIVTFDIDGNPMPEEDKAPATEGEQPAEGSEDQPAQQ
jgi:hypothetical protein